MDPTYFKLDINPGPESPDGIAAYINSDQEMVAAFGAAVVEQEEETGSTQQRGVVVMGGEPEKWCHDEFEAAMAGLSAAYPAAMFTVHGEDHYEGEDAFWVAYFTKGKSQIEPAEVVYPSFDGTKLRERSPGLEG